MGLGSRVQGLRLQIADFRPGGSDKGYKVKGLQTT